jgi:3-oxoacyl-[acyl-carrier protein] reductase
MKRALVTGGSGAIGAAICEQLAATKALAQEVASRGILVNAVAPGIIESPMSESAFTPERIGQIVPLKRAGKPQDVADLVSFLVSDRANYITGQVISVNGGMA